MKRFRIVGLCLMAVFAFSAIAASAASAALPEWLGTFPTPFTSHGGEAILKVGTVSKVKCASTTNTGSITGPKLGTVLVNFTGCKLSGSFPCNSPGAGTEEIMTFTLDMTLGYITKSTKDVGVALKGLGGAEKNLLAEFECNDEGALLPARVKGSVIGLITPIGVSTLTFTLNFAENATTKKQAVEKLEGEAKDVLEASLNRGVFEEGVEIALDEILTEKDLKIDA
jgi:hypothetical protein